MRDSPVQKQFQLPNLANQQTGSNMQMQMQTSFTKDLYSNLEDRFGAGSTFQKMSRQNSDLAPSSFSLRMDQ